VTQRDELERRFHRLRTDVVLGTRPRSGLIDGLAGEHTERDRDRQCRDRELGERARDRVGENVEVSGLTSDQAAERHDRIEASRSRQHRDGRWQLERAGDLELLDLRAFGEGATDGALGERSGDLVVPAGPNDRDARAARGILSPSRSLPSRRHLSQSSPRMQSYSVSG
jgi:hypothetical protein